MGGRRQDGTEIAEAKLRRIEPDVLEHIVKQAVVTDAEAAPDRRLAVAEGIIGKAQPRGKVLVLLVPYQTLHVPGVVDHLGGVLSRYALEDVATGPKQDRVVDRGRKLWGGPKYSQRRPAFSVSLRVTLTSSWKNRAISF